MAHPRTPSAEAQERMARVRAVPPAPGVVAAAVELPVPAGPRESAAAAAHTVTVRPSRLPAPFDQGFPATMRPVLAGFDEEAHGPVYMDADEPLPTPGVVDVLLNEFAYLEACVRDLAPDASAARRHLVYLAFLRRHAQLAHLAAKCDIVHAHLVALRREQIQTLRLQLAADEADLARLERGRAAGFAGLARHVRQHMQQPSAAMRELHDVERWPLAGAASGPEPARSLVSLMHEAGVFARRACAQRQHRVQQGDPPSSPSVVSPVGTPPSSPRRARLPPRKGPPAGKTTPAWSRPACAGKTVPPTRPATAGKSLPAASPPAPPPSTGGKRPRVPASPPVPTPPRKRPRSGSIIWSSSPWRPVGGLSAQPSEASSEDSSEAASEDSSALPSETPPASPSEVRTEPAFEAPAAPVEAPIEALRPVGRPLPRPLILPHPVAHYLDDPPASPVSETLHIPVNLQAFARSPLS